MITHFSASNFAAEENFEVQHDTVAYYTFACFITDISIFTPNYRGTAQQQHPYVFSNVFECVVCLPPRMSLAGTRLKNSR